MIQPSELVSAFDNQEAPSDVRASQDRLNAMRLGMQLRSQAYRTVFNFDSLPAFTVMQDLAWVCRANRSLFIPDPIQMAHRAGMHDVWLRIQHHIALTPTQLVALYSDVFVKEGFGK